MDKVDPFEVGCFVHLTHSERTIYGLLARSFGKMIPNTRILGALYDDDPNGGPDRAHRTLAQHVTHLRHVLKPYNLTVSNSLREGYILRWKEEVAA